MPKYSYSITEWHYRPVAKKSYVCPRELCEKTAEKKAKQEESEETAKVGKTEKTKETEKKQKRNKKERKADKDSKDNKERKDNKDRRIAPQKRRAEWRKLCLKM